MCRYLSALTDSHKFEKVQQFFPIRGHSFLPCGRDFGIIKRQLKKYDGPFNVDKVCDIILHSTNIHRKLEIKQITPSDIFKFKDQWRRYYTKISVSLVTRKKPCNERVSFAITTQFHYIFESKLKVHVKCSSVIYGSTWSTYDFSLKRYEALPLFPTSLSITYHSVIYNFIMEFCGLSHVKINYLD